MLDSCSEDWFSFCQNLESFVVDIYGVFMGSWLPGCPVEVDVEFVSINESSEEMQVISFSVHVDRDNAVVSSKGEYCGGRESSSCETRMRGSGEGGMRDSHSLESRVISWEEVVEFMIVGDGGACTSLNHERCSLADRRGEGGTDDGFLWLVSMAFMHE